MATKTKTSETTAQAPELMVDKVFSEGIEFLAAGNLAKAAQVFEDLQAQASAQGRLDVVRTAKAYLKAAQRRMEGHEAPKALAPEMEAQLKINDREPAAALECLDGALKAQPDRAVFHYLKALALVQMEQPEAAAEALGAALNLDPEFIYQFRLEPGFDGVRQHSAFATFQRA
jgi:tetratricopeptide (TPR) repeat protein